MFIGNKGGKTKMSKQVFLLLAGIVSTQSYNAVHFMQFWGCICIQTYICVSAIYICLINTGK